MERLVVNDSDQEDGEHLGDDSSNEKQSKNSDGDESNTDENETYQLLEVRDIT